MAKQNTREELSKARLEYIANRETLLQAKVDRLAIVLFDKINESFLKKLEVSDGKVKASGKNLTAVQAINSIYENFNKNYNAPIIKNFVGELTEIGNLNQKYFDVVVNKNTEKQKIKAEIVVNDQLGISKGKIVNGGFTDKFIKNHEVLDAIKQKTLQGIAQGKGFQQLRNDLKETIQGLPKENNGKLHQYYRNNAYDTYTKVDRIYSDTMAKDLKLTFFYWSGGVINTTRALCEHMNGKIVNAIDFKKMRFKNLKLKYRPGVPDGKFRFWKPLFDLGGYGCRHIKDYISTAVASRRHDDFVDLNSITISKIVISPLPEKKTK